MHQQTAESRLILKMLSGSHAYGTAVEDSDTDYRGILIAPKKYYLGLDSFEQYESTDPDVVYYDIRKFLRLCLKGNPNILELLFATEHELVTSYGQELIDLRYQFLTKRCATTYLGYAEDQLEKMQRSDAPSSRSEKRTKLVELYGYDVKFAMHLVRLCHTGIEVLRDGELNVRRPDAEELVEIRNGKYSFPDMIEYSEELIQQMREAEDHCTLPSKPDYDLVNRKLIDIVERYLKENDNAV